MLLQNNVLSPNALEVAKLSNQSIVIDNVVIMKIKDELKRVCHQKLVINQPRELFIMRKIDFAKAFSLSVNSQNR